MSFGISISIILSLNTNPGNTSHLQIWAVRAVIIWILGFLPKAWEPLPEFVLELVLLQINVKASQIIYSAQNKFIFWWNGDVNLVF